MSNTPTTEKREREMGNRTYEVWQAEENKVTMLQEMREVALKFDDADEVQRLNRRIDEAEEAAQEWEARFYDGGGFDAEFFQNWNNRGTA